MIFYAVCVIIKLAIPQTGKNKHHWKECFIVMKHNHAAQSELVKELNSRLEEGITVERLTTWIDGDIDDEFKIYMEGWLKGDKYTSFFIGVEGKCHCIFPRMICDKNTIKMFTTYEERNALDQFLLEKVVPLYCWYPNETRESRYVALLLLTNMLLLNLNKYVNNYIWFILAILQKQLSNLF